MTGEGALTGVRLNVDVERCDMPAHWRALLKVLLSPECPYSIIHGTCWTSSSDTLPPEMSPLPVIVTRLRLRYQTQ